MSAIRSIDERSTFNQTDGNLTRQTVGRGDLHDLLLRAMATGPFAPTAVTLTRNAG